MNKFPSIEQFRHVVRHVRDQAAFDGAELPTIAFTGTVKLHGTNAGIFHSGDQIGYMSRNRVLTVGDDNLGFAAHMSEHEEVLREAFERLRLFLYVRDDE